MKISVGIYTEDNDIELDVEVLEDGSSKIIKEVVRG